ncbi:hypothetical protein PtA15_9A399 [Puccinia triticina]|uniref:Pectinesterase n=1 Tax=Puccinia triticina TaxID=208348 RepID=A0ABY7CZY8_9BASI|nr:uncharacterized protein PtA15_9A399 [Puccinia triticina]WAQ88272.1 hypothetical protein PtA15_9A399 [Puccinia triticina]
MTVIMLANKLFTVPQWYSLILFSFAIFAASHALPTHSLSPRANPSSTVPPTGALIVRQKKPLPGEHPTIPDAIRALRGNKGPQTIFIYPGSYNLGVYIRYGYPLTIQGYTAAPGTYAQNQVTVSVATGRAETGGDPQSSAIWVQQNDFKMSNINVVNSYGTGTNTQAVAVTAQGERHVYSMCSFSSYQDTLYIKSPSAYFIGCNIEGAVDFIFGGGTAWFEKANIVVKPPRSFATITAHKRAQASSTAKFVFNLSNVIGAPGAKPGSAFLGRPWSAYAAVTFQFCSLSNVVNPAGWAAWNPPQDTRTQSVQFYEFANKGPGSQGLRSFGKSQVQPAKIEQVLGLNYASWAL